MILALDLARHDAAAILADDAGAHRAASRLAISTESFNREGTRAAWQVLIDAAREVTAQTGTGPADIAAVRIAFPARLQNGIVQRGIDTDGWDNFQPAHAFAQAFGFQNVQAVSRVACAATGEARFGALRDVSSSLFLQLDETFDAAISGEQFEPINLGAICLDRDGIVGPHGRRGELAAYLGGGYFEARAASFGLTHRSATEIWAMANNSAAAQSLCEDSARRLAQGIGVAQSLFSFDTVCLGGAIAETAGTFLRDLVARSCGEFCAPELKFVGGTLGRDAAVLGALALGRSTVEFDRTHSKTETEPEA